MVELLVFKSMLFEVYDFRKVDISPYLGCFAPDEARCKKDLEALCARYGKKIKVETVSVGDLVTLGYSSPMPRFNRKRMALRVGEGKIAPELERALVGMAVGESKTVRIGVIDVTLNVYKCVHTVPAELTDEAVLAFGLEGVSTVADLRAMCIGKQIEAFVEQDESVDAIAAYLWQETDKNSDIEFDPAELAFVHGLAEKKFAELKGRTVETEEGEVPITCDMLTTMYETELRMAIVGQRMMLSQEHTCLTEDDYLAFIKQDADARPLKYLSELESEDGRMEYMVDQYSDYLARAIGVYIADELKARHAKE